MPLFPRAPGLSGGPRPLPAVVLVGERGGPFGAGVAPERATSFLFSHLGGATGATFFEIHRQAPGQAPDLRWRGPRAVPGPVSALVPAEGRGQGVGSVAEVLPHLVAYLGEYGGLGRWCQIFREAFAPAVEVWRA